MSVARDICHRAIVAKIKIDDVALSERELLCARVLSCSNSGLFEFLIRSFKIRTGNEIIDRYLYSSRNEKKRSTKFTIKW